MARLNFILILLFILIGCLNFSFSDEIIKNKIVVKFSDYISDKNIKKLHIKALGTEPKISYESKYIKNLQVIKLPKWITVKEAIEYYKRLPFVEYVEPVYIYKPLELAPNDANFSNQWGLFVINVTKAWNLTTGSKNVYVVVIDTGIDYRHEDLKDNLWRNDIECNGIPGEDDDGNGFIDDCYGINAFAIAGYEENLPNETMDYNGHGTHVAGIIGAVGNNSIGVTGVNWNISIITCKAGNVFLTTDSLLICYDYVLALKNINGLDIVATSNSYGGYYYSRFKYEAIKKHAKEGILFIAAAGNEMNNNDFKPIYPASYDLPNVISVAAIYRNLSLASFSNFGKHSVHIAAPGVDILSTIPNNTYKNKSGTSMATPFVTGVAALLKAYNQNLTWYEIRNLILAGGYDVPSLKNYTITGKILDAYSSLACNNKSLLAILKPILDVYTKGDMITIKVLSINCSKPLDVTITITKPDGSNITIIPDGDGTGIYKYNLTLESTGIYRILVKNSAGKSLEKDIYVSGLEGNVRIYKEKNVPGLEDIAYFDIDNDGKKEIIAEIYDEYILINPNYKIVIFDENLNKEGEITLYAYEGKISYGTLSEINSIRFLAKINETSYNYTLYNITSKEFTWNITLLGTNIVRSWIFRDIDNDNRRENIVILEDIIINGFRIYAIDFFNKKVMWSIDIENASYIEMPRINYGYDINNNRTEDIVIVYENLSDYQDYTIIIDGSGNVYQIKNVHIISDMADLNNDYLREFLANDKIIYGGNYSIFKNLSGIAVTPCIEDFTGDKYCDFVLWNNITYTISFINGKTLDVYWNLTLRNASDAYFPVGYKDGNYHKGYILANYGSNVKIVKVDVTNRNIFWNISISCDNICPIYLNLDPIGDLNGDGAFDLVLEMSNYGNRIIAIDGKNGKVIWNITNATPLFVGDFNGDKKNDIIIIRGSPYNLHNYIGLVSGDNLSQVIFNVSIPYSILKIPETFVSKYLKARFHTEDYAIDINKDGDSDLILISNNGTDNAKALILTRLIKEPKIIINEPVGIYNTTKVLINVTVIPGDNPVKYVEYFIYNKSASIIREGNLTIGSISEKTYLTKEIELQEGEYIILVRVVDSYGLSANATSIFSIMIPPKISFISPTPENGTTIKGIMSFKIRIKTNEKVQAVFLHVIGRVNQTIPMKNISDYEFELKLFSGEIPDGRYIYYACAYDYYNNTGCTENRTISIMIPPIIEIYVSNLEVNKTSNITIGVFDIGGINYVRIQILGNNVDTLTPEPYIFENATKIGNVTIIHQQIYKWPIVAISPGKYKVIVFANDTLGNNKTITKEFYVYNITKYHRIGEKKINETIKNETIASGTLEEYEMEVYNNVSKINVSIVKLNLSVNKNVSLKIPSRKIELEIDFKGKGRMEANVTILDSEDEIEVMINPYFDDIIKEKIKREKILRFITIDAKYENATNFTIKIPFNPSGIDINTVFAYCYNASLNEWFEINKSGQKIPYCENRTIYKFERGKNYILIITDKLSVFIVAGNVKKVIYKPVTAAAGAAAPEEIFEDINILDENLLKKIIENKGLKYKHYINVSKEILASLLSVSPYTLRYPWFKELKEYINKVPENITGKKYEIMYKYVKKIGWKETVILARGDLIVDSYAALALARKLNVPIILSDPETLPNETIKLINEIRPKNVIIIGGPVAISRNVKEKLKKLVENVERIWGETRIETSVEIAKKFGYPKHLIITNWNSSEIAAYVAYLYEAPILYIKGKNVSRAVKGYLKMLKEKYAVPKIIFIDVPEEVVNEIKRIVL